MRYVVESPLAGDFKNNFRFLLWCCRAIWLNNRAHAIGSHMLNPWFMDDTNQEERQAGIDNPWVWGRDAIHVLFTDLGVSRGMALAEERCGLEITCVRRELRLFAPDCWQAYLRGEWPPHTPAFELA